MLTLANTGVPMLFVVGPVLVIALLPIALIEAALYRWRIGVSWQRAVLGSLGANVISTIFGVPITWFVLLLLQIVTGGGGDRGVGIHTVTLQAPWLIPHQEQIHWRIPAAGMVLCVPFMLSSVWIEYLCLRKIWKEFEHSKIRRACWLANALTYAGLIAFWGIQLMKYIPR